MLLSVSVCGTSTSSKLSLEISRLEMGLSSSWRSLSGCSAQKREGGKTKLFICQWIHVSPLSRGCDRAGEIFVHTELQNSLSDNHFEREVCMNARFGLLPSKLPRSRVTTQVFKSIFVMFQSCTFTPSLPFQN